MKRIVALILLFIPAIAQTVNSELWYDGTNEQVNTGAECMYEFGVCEGTTMGYWYTQDGRKYLYSQDGKKNKIYPKPKYPFDTCGYYGSLTAPMIDILGYLTIEYYIDKPDTTDPRENSLSNFVSFGFNTVSGRREPLDITSTGGLCITYTSDDEASLQVKEEKSGVAYCYVTLPKSEDPITVSSEISSFKQPVWTPDSNRLDSCAEAFAATQSIFFNIENSDLNKDHLYGRIRIFEIGPIGTCTGKAEIKVTEEPSSYSQDIDWEGHFQPCCQPPIYIGKEKGGFQNTMKRAAISIAGHQVYLDRFHHYNHYTLLDIQGNIIDKGNVDRVIDLSGVKSGNYILTVKGNVPLTQQIVLK
ncbi:hypothetical protein [uncultured Fibrobacter sp.]|uniref:hypothetical protein n=1 Tax=uncultured Fibrobacter sp. TaxID=261512 RepID=UPI0026259113|nr:hypothetical protein [uncultured Fibrobacter sp.]